MKITRKLVVYSDYNQIEAELVFNEKFYFLCTNLKNTHNIDIFTVIFKHTTVHKLIDP